MKVLEVQSYTSSLHLPHYCLHYRLPQGWAERLTGLAPATHQAVAAKKVVV